MKILGTIYAITTLGLKIVLTVELVKVLTKGAKGTKEAKRTETFETYFVD